VLSGSVPAAAGLPATAADRSILGPLPDQPDGAPPVMGLRQEHPSAAGAWLLSADASIHGLAGERPVASSAPPSIAAAVDVATLPSGPLRLLADGTTWTSAGTAGPRLPVSAPVRLLVAVDGAVLAFGAGGAIGYSPSPSGGGQGGGTVSLTAGASVVDAALFPETHSGLALDSGGALHAFGGADAALPVTPSSWTLPGQAAAITLAGTTDAPAGVLIDASGDWQVFGSLLVLPDATFGGPVFDPATGLPLR